MAFTAIATASFSQNLVRNCDLEARINCPYDHGQLFLCSSWYSPGTGTSDYLNSCNTDKYGVPVNMFGEQAAHSGSAYAHLILYYPMQGHYREYMQTELACRLEEGKEYLVSFFVSCADDSRYAIDAIGLYLSMDPLMQDGDELIAISGDVHIRNTPGTVIDDKSGWTMISGSYIASGGERFLTIGNFSTNGETTTQAFTGYQTNLSSYYVDDISVICTSPPISLGNDTTICPYDSIFIDVSGICNQGNLQWADGFAGLTRWIKDEGTYSLEGTLGCSSFYDEITITHSNDPGSFLPADTAICPGRILDLTCNQPFAAYTWQDGSNLPYLPVGEGGVFWVDVTDNQGCKFSDTSRVMQLYQPYFELGSDTLLCIGQELLIDPQVDSAFNNFLWSDNSTGLTLLVEDSALYWLRVVNPCGEHYDQVLVDTRNCFPTLLVPNAFTPNNDGLNDIFLVRAENIFNYRMMIFDRWGKKVFESNDQFQGWDGMLEGTPAPAGAYVWIAFFDVIADDWSYEKRQEKGSVLIVH